MKLESNMKFSERDLIALGRKLASAIRKALIRELKSDERELEPEGVKAQHASDLIAFRIIEKEFKGLAVKLEIEGFETINPEIQSPSIFIDPLDGSRNWERQIGDPAFALAYAEKEGEICFRDLQFAYVEGLRSGDQYFSLKGKAFYRSKLLNKNFRLQKRKTKNLKESTAYIKPGYSAAQKALDYSKDIILYCKDIRAIDNSATELCELARGACDFIIEARDLSDFHNLLAFPILKNCGGVLSNLEGELMDRKPAIPGKIYNFTAFAHADLMHEFFALKKGDSLNR
jgi:fructose-1,6-bisphosphatase/inositol monophosphatase family enzyme